jgi:hypothetical protein
MCQNTPVSPPSLHLLAIAPIYVALLKPPANELWEKT